MNKGVIGLGMWCVDTTYKINELPERGKLEPILDSFQCVGGGPSNVLTDLSSLGFNYPMIAMGSIGLDGNASIIKNHLKKNNIQINLKYFDGEPVIKELKRISTPGRRVYTNVKNIPKVRQGLGIAIISTPKGVMSDSKARATNVGGEILCTVF